MNRNKCKRGRATQVPVFILKLQDMVENRHNQHYIHWTSSQDSFQIKNVSKFTDQLLPKYFKHRNFASFIRQLNMYCFRKIRHVDGDHVYFHQFFKMGRKSLLKNINRKIKEEKDQPISMFDVQVDRLNCEGNRTNDRDIDELKENQKNLEDMCSNFMEQNQKLMEENANLVKKIEEQSTQKQKKIQSLLLSLLFIKKKALTNGENTQLSLTNDSNPLLQDNNSTPLEIIAQNMQNSTSGFKIHNLIQKFYESMPSQTQNIQLPLIPQPQKIESEPNKSDKSFLSINDFLNADDYEGHINLEDSR